MIGGDIMTSYGLNMQSVKSKNRSLILYLLNKHKQLSRKEIATLSSLTPAAVTKICQSLIDEGYIRECGELSDDIKIGRKEIALTLCLDERICLGVNAECDVITLSLSTFDGNLIHSKRIDFTDDLATVVAGCKELLLSLDVDKSKLSAVGVCVIGSPYDDDYSVWDTDDIISLFGGTFGVDVIVENNVKAYATSTLLYDNLNDSRALFLKWGPGIGSSIIANGQVLSGNDSGVTEIGHYIVNSGGKACRCGRFGCLETEASCDAIINQIDANLSLDKIIYSCDNNIINIIDEKIDLVALALTNTATILNASSIVLFGSMFKNSVIVEKMIRQCARYNFRLDDGIIRLSSLNDKSDYIGACAICAKSCFFEREV